MEVIFKSLVFLVLMIFSISGFGHHRVIKGTVYSKEGKRVSGVIVTANKSKGKYFTSFDGFYEISVNSKTKWIKFTFPESVEKLNIVGITRDVIDFGEDSSWVKSDTIQNNEIKEGNRINECKHK